MSLLTVDKMYLGEMAEITFFNLEQQDAKKLRDMGLREGGIIELTHLFEPLFFEIQTDFFTPKLNLAELVSPLIPLKHLKYRSNL